MSGASREVSPPRQKLRSKTVPHPIYFANLLILKLYELILRTCMLLKLYFLPEQFPCFKS
jgi:hypothetical protein